MLEKKLERKMKKFSPKSKMLPSGCCCPVEEETTLHLGFQKGNNPAHLGRKERACNRSSKLVTWSSLMSNDPVLRRRKERACNPWDSRLAGLWACCWPCGLAAGLAGFVGLLACFFFYSFSFSTLVCT